MRKEDVPSNSVPSATQDSNQLFKQCHPPPTFYMTLTINVVFFANTLAIVNIIIIKYQFQDLFTFNHQNPCQTKPYHGLCQPRILNMINFREMLEQVEVQVCIAPNLNLWGIHSKPLVCNDFNCWANPNPAC